MGERVAEWVLELVLSPEHAASAIGDWKEDRRVLWVGVLRIVVSRVWTDLSGAPVDLLWLAIRGYLLMLLLLFAVFVPLGLILAAVFGQPVSSFHPIFDSLDVAFSPGMAFLVCRWVAKRVPGREMAGFVAIGLVAMIVYAVAKYYWASDFSVSFIYGVAFPIFLFYGALAARRKTRQRLAQ